jgi:putative peptide zinc metalloprotease protein
MYNKIEVFETDFADKYLLKLEDKTIYAGIIIKDIIELLKDYRTKKEIINIINSEHKINLNIAELNKIIESKIDKIFILKKTNSLIKLFKIIDPSKFQYPKIAFKLFAEGIFYKMFILTLIINIIAFFFVKNKISNNLLDWTILYVLLLCILLIHEFGHSISAKKFNVIVKELGFGLYNIFPVFYVDLGEAWRLSIKKRTMINLSGIYAQSIIGVFLLSLSLLFKNNFILLGLYQANLTIIILNFNPFLKFDGYWIVSDLLNENNLMKKSNTILKNIIFLKKPNETNILIIYSILRLCFIIWLTIIITIKLHNSILKITSNQTIYWYEYIPIAFLIFIIYNILKPLIQKKK